MWIFTPRYLKNAQHLLKGVTRFLNYKRDVLPVAVVQKIETLRTDLKAAIKQRDAAQIDALDKQINSVCSKAIPDYKQSWLGENVEVFFVAIVVALGIRAYIAQPFQIPTASMRPTLNGYLAQNTEDDPTPNFLKQLWDKKNGLTYINVVSDHTGMLSRREAVTEHRFLLVFTYCTINFEDGHSIRVWAPRTQLENPRVSGKDETRGLGFKDYVGAPVRELTDPMGRKYYTPDGNPVHVTSAEGMMVKEGQVLARGILTSGDHVLVNKFAYHFRRPSRGEVFVFNTRNIDGIRVTQDEGSQHYIKRLVGVPGDELEVKSPELWINGQRAQEPGMARVMRGTKDKPVEGYRGYSSPYDVGGSIHQRKLDDQEYFAMGDNSYNSSDSRVWGPVPERNVLGPALFCYLPFGPHWGLIR